MKRRNSLVCVVWPVLLGISGCAIWTDSKPPPLVTTTVITQSAVRPAPPPNTAYSTEEISRAAAPARSAGAIAASPARANAPSFVFRTVQINRDTAFSLEPDQAAALVDAAIKAEKIVIRSRAQMSISTPAVIRETLERGDRAREYLISQGIPAERIWTRGGGPADPDNEASRTRSMYRRVDFEMYGQALPAAVRAAPPGTEPAKRRNLPRTAEGSASP